MAGSLGCRALMIQGAGSNVGKSLIVAGLCRAFARRGLRVRPFKPQNMSNNAAATEEGEIGRAQALQARACGVAPSVHMNPVLLKPQSETGSQIVVQGKVVGAARAADYQNWKPRLMARVVESFEILRGQADLVIVEGAGSASEINLRANDIANMGFARQADIPVVLVGDIERGGVIAQMVGARAVLDSGDADLIAGFIVNKFRGDPALFAPALETIERRTGWASLGLVPYFERAALLPGEDSLALQEPDRKSGGPLTIVVPILPHVANFDDLDPLKFEPGVRLLLLRNGEPLPPAARLAILLGSKSTIADLDVLQGCGWSADLVAHARRGGKVLGLCGGYQMLGGKLSDPQGIEGPIGAREGLGLLDVETVLTSEKRVAPVRGVDVDSGARFAGYEIHLGETRGPDCARPVLRFDDGRLDGAASRDGRIRGTYAHGLFTGDASRAAWLRWAGAASSNVSYETEIESIINGLAEHLETHVEVDRLLKVAR